MPVMGDRNRKRWKRRKHWNGWLKRAVALRCHLFHHVTSTPTNHKAISKYRRFFANYWSFPVNFGQHFWMGFVCFFWVFLGFYFGFWLIIPIFPVRFSGVFGQYFGYLPILVSFKSNFWIILFWFFLVSKLVPPISI